MLFNDIMVMSLRDSRGKEGSAARAALARSERFFLSPKVAETCRDLARSAASVTSWRFLFTPAVDTFFEWRTPDVQGPTAQRGCWLIGAEGSAITYGAGFLIRRTSTQEVRLREFVYFFENPLVFHDPDGKPLSDDPEGTVDALNFLLACLALLNTPRLASLHDADLSALNKRRADKHLTPLLDYKTVELRLDEARQSRGSEAGEPGHHFRRHHVRSHLRIKRARVEVVRPHWRGNAALGVVVKHRALTLGDAA